MPRPVLLKTQSWAGTFALARLVWRRDRARIPVWIAGIALTTILVALAYPGLFPTELERMIMSETMSNPALIAMAGPGYGLADYTIGPMFAHHMLLFTAIAAAIMNITEAVRHTRRDEEGGRIEIIRSLPVGKLANAGAVFLVLSLTNLAVGLVVGLGLAALRIESMGFAGSVLYGAVLAATGLFFAAVTVLFAQVTETSRAALGLSFGFLGIAYLLRAVGDISKEALSLVSPLGLVLRCQVYVNDYWWPILLMLGASVFIGALAFVLNLMRDLGAGLIAAKPGPARAGRLLRSTWGLAVRLQKPMLAGWAVAMLFLGLAYGSVFADLDKFFESSEMIRGMLPAIPGFSLTDQFTALLLLIMTMFAAVPALLMTLKLRGEEKASRLEHLLARAVSKGELLRGYVIISLLVAVLMQVLAALGLWMAASSVMESPFAFWPLFKGAVSYVPAIWIYVGIAALLIGFLPRYTGLIWAYLGYTFTVLYLGRLIKAPEWLVKLTPFGHIPNVPLETMPAGQVLVMLALALVFIWMGDDQFGRRDYER
ncbi:MAG: ABC transporter permease [Bacillota bacterium]|nr:ABC transporter permease [Bacillota bacterium]